MPFKPQTTASGAVHGASLAFLPALFLAFVLLAPGISPAYAAQRMPVYTDALARGWEDWSWGGVERHFDGTSPVHTGERSCSVRFTEAWSGLQMARNDPVDIGDRDTLRFWIHGGSTGGQTIQVSVGNGCATAGKTVTPAANAWTRVDIPLRDLGKPARISLLAWFNATAGSQGVFYLDDVAFIRVGAPEPGAIRGPALTVSANALRHRINPLIYGMNFADETLAAELKLPLRRRGGNATTRYNWENDTSNHASDWFFENIPDSDDPTGLPDGSDADRFVEQDLRTGTETLLTVPLIGWTPASREVICGYSVAKYGAQQETDPWRPDCGNGILTDGTPITGNDPLDTSIEITPIFVQNWMAHLAGRYGTAAHGGVRYYDLDNEPMLWNSTHRDVHPSPTSYDELRDRTIAYAAAIKASDPGARTCGPAVWGWTAYFWSALDAAPGGNWWDHPADRLAHGNIPFIDWYLAQMKDYETQQGFRILDVLDVHYYPQADGVFSQNTGDVDTRALRLRSTRALWDRTYTDESWIAEPVYLVPRLREWTANRYPGTKTCIGEYSWGALCHVNGALAQADVLGIFGRERLDMATLWGPPAADEPGAFAFRMYLNYNGEGARFGETSVRALSGNQERLAVYAAERTADGALTLVVVNKFGRALTSPLKLSGFTPSGTARVFRYGLEDTTRIVRQPDQPVAATGFTATYPANSITVVEIPGTRS